MSERRLTLPPGNSSTNYRISFTLIAVLMAMLNSAQRNMYLTGFTLFLSIILTRTFYILLDLVHVQEEYSKLKQVRFVLLLGGFTIRKLTSAFRSNLARPEPRAPPKPTDPESKTNPRKSPLSRLRSRNSRPRTEISVRSLVYFSTTNEQYS